MWTRLFLLNCVASAEVRCARARLRKIRGVGIGCTSHTAQALETGGSSGGTAANGDVGPGTVVLVAILVPVAPLLPVVFRKIDP